ncbi:nitrate/nitrite transporter [Antrihabitans spumae]|uniref:Nitrate/nitrite transporter n=1 Tax=Antrihabitans spumae TaxID=3373370 RepID=A0ABW7JYP9_9NOCA
MSPVSGEADTQGGRWRLRERRWIADWDPEDVERWNNGGARVAKRNLIYSIFAEHVGFSVWSIWSVMVLFMPVDKYGIDTGGKFLLLAVPTLTGAILRLAYTFAPAKFGGRNWTIVSAAILAVPTLLALYFILHPETSYTTWLFVAALAGFGGGNFASSMTNINSFYPQRLKGWALGLNAGGGNLGVPAIQIVGLLALSAVGDAAPSVVCAVYLVLIAAASIAAAAFMDNLSGQDLSPRVMVNALRFGHSWVISLLYIGTFGSFIGYSFAFGQLLQINFVASGETPAQAALHAAQIAFVGPLLGSLSRPLGGKLSDRIGGGRVTFYTFVAMLVAAGALVVASSVDDNTSGATGGGVMAVYVLAFIVLFILSGVGNGSTYKMIPAVFEVRSWRLSDRTPNERAAWSRSMAGALIGFAGAIGAIGGVLINVVLRISYSGAAKSATDAFFVFAGFYLLCAIVTWYVFLRRRAVDSMTGDDGLVAERALSSITRV